MIIVKVTYTLKPDFVLKNQENITLFLNDFKKIDSTDFRYIAYIGEDGKTFTHISMYQHEEIQKQLLAVASFKAFQKERNESGLEADEKIEMITLAGASYDIFN
ncbi:hypothetical protein [Spirosoma arcticum]